MGIQRIISSPNVQRGIKAAEITGIETAKALLLSPLFKNDPMVGHFGLKFMGDMGEGAVRVACGQGVSLLMMMRGKPNRDIHKVVDKIMYGNPFNVISTLGLLKSRERWKEFTAFAKGMWRKPY